MKKFTFGSVLVLSLALVGCGAQEQTQEVSAPQAVESVQIDTYHNVGNGVTYAYKVTEVTEGEIHGTPLNYASEGNKGIFLLENEVDFEVAVGDEIAVVWGEEEDEFQSIERAVETEDGSYVLESYYDEMTVTMAVDAIEGDVVTLIANGSENGFTVSLSEFDYDVQVSDLVAVSINRHSEFTGFEFLEKETAERKAEMETLLAELTGE